MTHDPPTALAPDRRPLLVLVDLDGNARIGLTLGEVIKYLARRAERRMEMNR